MTSTIFEKVGMKIFTLAVLNIKSYRKFIHWLTHEPEWAKIKVARSVPKEPELTKRLRFRENVYTECVLLPRTLNHRSGFLIFIRRARDPFFFKMLMLRSVRSVLKKRDASHFGFSSFTLKVHRGFYTFFLIFFI